jgi:hypothetical protein
MSISGRSRSSRRRWPALSVAMASLVLVLAACGGGNGGGDGGDSGYTLKLAVANKTQDAVDITLDDGEPQPVDGCKGAVLTFNLPATDWTINVNGQSAIDSTQLDSNVIDSNIIGELNVNSDGTPELVRVDRGSNIQPPSSYGLCS